MACLLFLGLMAVCLSGMPPVPTPLQLHIARGQATAEAGKVATAAEDRKANKYIHLDSPYLFIPLAFETLGVFGPKTLAFVRELGRRISQEMETSFLMQRLSMAVQMGNSAAVLGSCRHP